MVSDARMHGDALAHQIDSTKSFSSDSDADPDLEWNQYGHLCHGHTASITASLSASDALAVTTEQQCGDTPHVLSQAQAPPTPPPNA